MLNGRRNVFRLAYKNNEQRSVIKYSATVAGMQLILATAISMNGLGV